MLNTIEQAIQRSLQITTGYAGYCLLFVQTCYNASAVAPSAIAAWNTSSQQHPTQDIASIPRGAPIYFAPHGSPYGHIAIYLGDSMMRTTNSSTGRIHTDPVKKWVTQYGYTLLGWTEDIEGQPIPELQTKTTQNMEEDMPVKTDTINWDGQNVTVEYALQDLKHKLDAIGSAKDIGNQIWFGQSSGNVEETPLYALRAVQNTINALAEKNGLSLSDIQTAVAGGVKAAINSITTTIEVK